MARRLGFRSNVIAEWESGRRSPTAERFLQACTRVHIDVQDAAERFSPNAIGAFDVSDVSPWLRALQGDSTVREVAERCQRPAGRVRRWLRGDTHPRLADFLTLLDALTGRAADWVATLVPIHLVPELEPRFLAIRQAERIAFDVPWSSAVLTLMETAAYRALPAHDATFLAAQLGTSKQVVDDAVQALIDSDLVVRSGETLQTKDVMFVNVGTDPVDLIQLKRFWAKVAADRVTTDSGDDMLFNLFAVNEADLDLIRAELRATFRSIRARVSQSQPSEVGALLTMHLCPLRAED